MLKATYWVVSTSPRPLPCDHALMSTVQAANTKSGP